MGKRVVLHLPKEIADSELSRYAILLNLSEAQLESMRRMHAGYIRNINAFMPASVDALTNQSISVAQLKGGSIEYAEGFEKLFAARQEFIEKLRDADRDFLDDIAPMMADEQLALLPNIELERDRMIYSDAFRSSHLSEARIDLIQLVENAFPEALKQLTDLHVSYLQSIVPVLKRKSEDAARKLATDSYLLAAMQVQAQEDAPANAAATLADRRRQNLAQQTALGKRLAAINRDFLAKFAEQLGPEDKEKLLNHFRLAAFPSIYPDPDYPDVLLRTVMDREGLSDDEKQAIAGMEATFHGSYKSVCNELERLEREWQSETGAKMSYHVDDLAKYEQKRESLLQKRSSLNQQIVQQIMGIAAPEEQVVRPVGN